MVKNIAIALIFAVIVTIGCNVTDKHKVVNKPTERSMSTKDADGSTKFIQKSVSELETKDFADVVLNNDVTIVDVRTKNEFDQGHLPNAINIDVQKNDFIEKMSQFDKKEPIYLYCRSGKRSGRAIAMLQQQGYYTIVELEEGYIDWKANDLPIK